MIFYEMVMTLQYALACDNICWLNMLDQCIARIMSLNMCSKLYLGRKTRSLDAKTWKKLAYLTPPLVIADDEW